MKRKVIKQANQAFTITLPIEWVRKNNIDKNSEIDIDIKGKSLLINSDSPTKGESIEFDSEGFNDRNIYMHIVAAYAQGVDEIKIISDKDISNLITKCLNSIIGYALVEHSNREYVIKDVNPGNYPGLKEMFKRVFQMIMLFYESAIQDIYGKEKETPEGLRARDSEVNKFCLYLQRAINKSSCPNEIEGRNMFTYSFALEKIGDEVERLWRTNIKYDVKKTPEIKKLLLLSKEGLEKAFEIYYQFNARKIEEIYRIREKVRNMSLKLKKLNADTTRFVRHAVKIVEEAADLNHLALMKKI